MQDEDLLCLCWCKAGFVRVPRDEILNGLTKSCGGRRCDIYDYKERKKRLTTSSS